MATESPGRQAVSRRGAALDEVSRLVDEGALKTTLAERLAPIDAATRRRGDAATRRR